MSKLNPIDYIGKVYKTNTSGDCFVVDMKSAQDITVMFYDGYCVKVFKGNLDKGKVKNPYHTNNLVQGVGLYDGTKITTLNESLKISNLWRNMLQRCYSESFHNKQTTYKDVSVSKEWLTYSNFERDIVNMLNYSLFINEGWELDKDLIVVGNKEYSKDNCCFLPRELNSKFSRISTIFENDVGVTKLPHGTFRVNVEGVRSEYSHIGCYRTKDEALRVYRKHKSEVLLKSLQKYEKVIDLRVITSITNFIEGKYDELVRVVN